VSGDTSSAAIAGSLGACTTLNRRQGTGWGGAGVCMLFCHERFEALTLRSDGNDGTRRGIWPHNGPLSLGPISGHPGFRPGVTVTVQFGHQEGGLRERAGAGGGVSRVGTHVLRVHSTKTVLEEDL